jgi:hypothetical protein
MKTMPKIKSCQFNMDNACVELIYDNGGMVSLYTPMIEESLRTTAYSRSKLDWLIDNEPLEYARMVIGGTMQEYLDEVDSVTQQRMKGYTKRLTERFPPNIAEDIARELIMYN